MIPGLNTNVDRDGERWHIQTEMTAQEPAIFTTQIFHHGVVVSTKQVPAPPRAGLGDLLKVQRQAHAAVVAVVEAGHHLE